MTLVATPAQGVLVDTLSQNQFEFMRSVYGINDDPYQPDRTYIIFDAASGNNNLHIITGSSLSYSIKKGDGTVAVAYTDTGGTKVLNYSVAGRYLITIDGNFQGIDTSGASAGDKNKYIGIIAGSNHPDSLAQDGFKDCVNFEIAIYPELVISSGTSGQNSFEGCTSLKKVHMPKVVGTSFFLSTFKGCTSLTDISLPSATTFGGSVFEDCTSLINVNLPSLTTTASNTFDNCISLVSISLDSVTTFSDNGFLNCTSLISVSMPSIVTLGNNVFDGCTRLRDISLISATTLGTSVFENTSALFSCNLPAVTTIGVDCFKNSGLVFLEINYSAGLSVGANAFLNVNLSDLYVIGAGSLVNAQAVETKITTAGMTQLTGYRLLWI